MCSERTNQMPNRMEVEGALKTEKKSNGAWPPKRSPPHTMGDKIYKEATKEKHTVKWGNEKKLQSSMG